MEKRRSLDSLSLELTLMTYSDSKRSVPGEDRGQMGLFVDSKQMFAAPDYLALNL